MLYPIKPTRLPPIVPLDNMPAGKFHALFETVAISLIGYLLYKYNNDDQITYRPSESASDYTFRFETQKDGTERAYIMAQPDYNGRPTDLHSTHRYYDSNLKLYYVCFDPMPTNRKAMRAVARLWAEKTEAYRLKGEQFYPP